MRLGQVKREIALGKRALFSLVGRVSGMKIPDVAYVVFHRPELFGRAYSGWLQELMRGESEWSVGERELIASFTALQQQCEF